MSAKVSKSRGDVIARREQTDEKVSNARKMAQRFGAGGSNLSVSRPQMYLQGEIECAAVFSQY